MQCDTRVRAETDGRLFRSLGYHRKHFYFLLVPSGRIVHFNSRELCGRGAALELVPDMDHWLQVSPLKTYPHLVDWCRAGAMLIAEATAAGAYEPPAWAMARRVGRPKVVA